MVSSARLYKRVDLIERWLRKTFGGMNFDIFGAQSMPPEGRWPYPGDYQSVISKMEERGCLARTLPSINRTQRMWGGIGVVVATHSDARRLQYDILAPIDEQLVSADRFDHLLVRERLPASLDVFRKQVLRGTAEKACTNFKSCLEVSDEAVPNALANFSTRVADLEISTAKNVTQEHGGSVYFEDNCHPYLRSLLRFGRVVVNGLGRNIAPLDELGSGRDLRERQQIVGVLCKQLGTGSWRRRHLFQRPKFLVSGQPAKLLRSPMERVLLNH